MTRMRLSESNSPVGWKAVGRTKKTPPNCIRSFMVHELNR